ncbi:helix-turn-helix transcriptional regulator [Kiloniella laminariae]|uniref:helix-turn-helix transcriptional regulator n=1 Tax=Kiloniella laminariae TaxID=454162 RepID=UPI00036A0CFF|nr:YafY family protein [Kiloniella laminariae]
MRASRLLSILMHLQKGQVTAEQLAVELEVSVRTIYRDMDHLSFAGVPVYADRGRTGGFQLLDGWRMPPTGLTGIETEALLLSGLPDQVRQLGLQAALLRGQNKLFDALPEAQRALIGKISAHVHVDPVSWFGIAEPASKLHEIANAVWNSRRIHCSYESWRGCVTRTINPLGLVVKGGTWYLAGLTDGDERIYRVSKFRKVDLLKDNFIRPSGFNLADFWQQAVRRYETNIYQATARLQLTRNGLKRIGELSASVAQAAEESCHGPDSNDCFIVSIPIESILQACFDLLRLGSDCQVLDPPELVEHIREEIDCLSRIYKN